jgi:hypothetical protein
MVAHAATELAAVVGQHGVHFDAMRFEGRQHDVDVKQMRRCRQPPDRRCLGVNDESSCHHSNFL